MKLLVVGGTGFIGHNLKDFFNLKREFEVFAPTRHELNLLDDQACLNYLKKIKPDLIIHAAVDINSVENSLLAFFNIYNAKSYYGHLVQIGSGAEYDGRIYSPLMDETKFYQSIPVNTYGLSKFCIGNLIESQNDSKCTNFRLFGIYGIYEDFNRRFISNNICRVLSGLQISMNRDMKFDYIYVDDFSDFIFKIADKLPLKSKSYNFCSGKPIHLSELALIIKSQMNVSSDIIIKQSGLNTEYSGSPKKIFDEIGPYQFSSHEQSISKLISYYKQKLSHNDLEVFRRDNC